MLRGDPLRVDIPGYTPRVVATADRIFVLVIAEIERTADGLRKPRRLYALDWSGRRLWSRDLDEGPAGPRVAADGLLWFAEPAALVGLDADGTAVRRIDVVLRPDEGLGAFVGLADGGFVIAAEATRGRRGPRGRVLRLDGAGALLWSRELMPDPRSPRAAADPPHRSLWRPENWLCVHHHPLLVAGDAVLCGFHEWPRSGFGRRFLLGLARGEPRWTGELGATGHAAIVGPGTFLVGAQGYGQFRSVLVGRGGVIDRWDTHGPALITNRLRVVELRNVMPSDQGTVTLLPGGTLARGELLPGYHTAPPAALADGTLVTWRAGALLQIDADGAMTRRHCFGPANGAAGRIVVGPGRLACVISDEDHGRGPWPLWIFPVDLPGLAAGPWPCDGGGPGDPGVLATPT